ncbi:MAG: bifunctional adenosylcobinamide kinase/adenosylcobinamide-phosphate guanylyltransferase [Caldilineaceae bacterium]|nr:bifunctional adenosylcobinamide kinase/adenosylcobinamide-phosphate guanylyltransferase [Caldilineaceae bacterium]
MNIAPLIFILGGARSGKSDYALELAQQMAGDAPVLFIATAQTGDGEMAERIVRHRAERPDHWQTLEAPLKIGELWRAQVEGSSTQLRVAILDCVTLLVSNVLFAEGSDPETEDEATVHARLRAEIDLILAAQRELACTLIVVSNEVGLGIVPLGRINRLYRDLIGRANRRLAAAADQAIFLVAGIPLDLTKLRMKEGIGY